MPAVGRLWPSDDDYDDYVENEKGGLMTIMKILITILYDYDDDDDCDDNGENEEGGLVKQRRERLPFP